MELEEGKRYITRNGLVTSPIMARQGMNVYTFCGNAGGSVLIWRGNGACKMEADSEFDLVSEWDAPADEAPQESPEAPDSGVRKG